MDHSPPPAPRPHLSERTAGWSHNVGAWLSFTVCAIALLMPTPAGMPVPAQRLAAVTLLMAALWVSQGAPIAATALIPLAAYPLLGIQTANDVSRSYIDANIFLYLGGFIIALGIEKWGLHRRMALHIVHAIGSSPRRIVLGFMVATGFLSMWISNTASTMLMLPIGLALLATLRELAGKDSAAAAAVDHRLGVALMLAIAYSASCGGLSTLVGTPTNVTFLGLWDQSELFPDAPTPSMAEWMICFVPLSVLMLACAFFVLTWRLPSGRDSVDPGRSFFRERIRALGPPSAGERAMFVILTTTAFLWIFRQPVQFDSQRFGAVTLLPGWGLMYKAWLIEHLGVDADLAGGAIHDATVAMLMALLTFFIRVPTADEGWQPLMDWETAERGQPWGILLLIGGGFAIADAFTQTGLSKWLGETLAANLQGASITVLVVTICLMMTFLTEFTSNVATVSTLVPILAGAAVSLGIDPRLLMIPATVTSSCAFMLPIATPPNAIVFTSGKVSMREMMGYGLALNLIGVILVTAVTFLLLVPVMGVSLDGLPEWVQQQ